MTGYTYIYESLNQTDTQTKQTCGLSGRCVQGTEVVQGFGTLLYAHSHPLPVPLTAHSQAFPSVPLEHLETFPHPSPQRGHLAHWKQLTLSAGWYSPLGS